MKNVPPRFSVRLGELTRAALFALALVGFSCQQGLVQAATPYTYRVPIAGLQVVPANPNTTGLTVSASALDFGTIAAGLTSSSQTLTVTNPSGAPVGLTSTSTAPFSLYQSTCGTSVPAGTSCSLTLDVSSKTQGALTGTLALTSLAGTYNVSLTAQISAPVDGYEVFDWSWSAFANGTSGYYARANNFAQSCSAGTPVVSASGWVYPSSSSATAATGSFCIPTSSLNAPPYEYVVYVLGTWASSAAGTIQLDRLDTLTVYSSELYVQIGP